MKILIKSPVAWFQPAITTHLVNTSHLKCHKMPSIKLKAHNFLIAFFPPESRALFCNYNLTCLYNYFFHTFPTNLSSRHFWLLFLNFFIRKGDKNQLRFIRTCEHNIIWYFYLYLEPSSNACIKQTAKYSTWFLSVDCTSHMIDLGSKVLHEAQHAWEKNNYDTNFAYILEETYNRSISKTVSRILLTISIIKAADFN